MGGVWQMPQGSRQVQVITFDGGHNVGAPAVSIADNQSSVEWGWDVTDRHPALHTRRGRKNIGGTDPGWHWLLTDFNGTLIRAFGTEIQKLDGSTWQAIGTGLTGGVDWDYTRFEVDGSPAIIFANGVDPVKYWDGTTFDDLDADAPTGRYITNDTIRVWMAEGDELVYSAFLNAQDWTTTKNSGRVQYFTPQGGDITALTRYLDRTVVFKSSSMAEVHGTNYYEFRLMDVSNDIGCLNFKTVKEVQGLLYWLGPGPDVYVYTGARPRAIGASIRPYLKNITNIDQCFAGTDGLNYFLGVINGSDSYVLVFNPRYQVWRVFDTEEYLHSHLMGTRMFFAGGAGVWEVVDGAGDETSINSVYITKPFDAGMPQADKEFYEAHLQGVLSENAEVKVYISRDDPLVSGGFELIDTITASSAKEQSHGFIIPMDSVPLCKWVRFKMEVTGIVELYQMQVYYDVHPVYV